jgi:hypothetical protein
VRIELGMDDARVRYLHRRKTLAVTDGIEDDFGFEQFNSPKIKIPSLT